MTENQNQNESLLPQNLIARFSQEIKDNLLSMHLKTIGAEIKKIDNTLANISYFQRDNSQAPYHVIITSFINTPQKEPSSHSHLQNEIKFEFDNERFLRIQFYNNKIIILVKKSSNDQPLNLEILSDEDLLKSLQNPTLKSMFQEFGINISTS